MIANMLERASPAVHRRISTRLLRSICHLSIAMLTVSVGYCDHERSAPDPSARLRGTWRLKELGGMSASQIGVTNWELTFASGAKWRYRGSLSGTLNGMPVDGEGRWHLQGNTLTYYLGSGPGSAIVHVTETELKLEPDPILVNPQNRHPVEAVYTKVPGPLRSDL
jgi:hypothetical protein